MLDIVKVLYFHQHYSTPKGATGIRSYEMSRRLIQAGHEVVMVCGSYRGAQTGLTSPFVKGRRRGMVDNIDVLEFDLGYSNSDSFIRRSWQFVKYSMKSVNVALKEPYDIVFATSTPLTAGIPGIFARWLRLKPFVFEVRDLWPELPRAMGVIKNPIILLAMSILEWLTYHSANRIIGLSPGIVTGIERRGIHSDKIELIPNGCDLEYFNQTVQPWRPEGVAASHFLAVYTGTHGIANGLGAVLYAAEELKRRNRDDIRIMLVGDGKLKSNLQAYAKVKCLDNVVFHPPVDKNQVASLMAGANVGLQVLSNVPAFYYGTSPNKFFDYISAGLPVVTNYPGWIADMIEKYDCGFVISADNPYEFADILECAADSHEALRIKGFNARSLAESRFDRNELAKSFIRCLEGAFQK